MKSNADFTKQKRILLVVSNPAVSAQTGWNIGVWAAELTHPYLAFTEAGYAVDIASPEGGEVAFDSFSDPRDASGYSAHDLISMGFIHTPHLYDLLKTTTPLHDVRADDYDAIFVCGGQGPMYTFVDNTPLHSLFAGFYEQGKIAAAICHGTCILLKAKLSDGRYLVDGKTWTGFANSEEDYADAFVNRKIQPFRIEDEAHRMAGTHFITSYRFAPFAVRDGNLITGQQQNSGAAAARLVIEALGINTPVVH